MKQINYTQVKINKPLKTLFIFLNIYLLVTTLLLVNPVKIFVDNKLISQQKTAESLITPEVIGPQVMYGGFFDELIEVVKKVIEKFIPNISDVVKNIFNQIGLKSNPEQSSDNNNSPNIKPTNNDGAPEVYKEPTQTETQPNNKIPDVVEGRDYVYNKDPMCGVMTDLECQTFKLTNQVRSAENSRLLPLKVDNLCVLAMRKYAKHLFDTKQRGHRADGMRLSQRYNATADVYPEFDSNTMVAENLMAQPQYQGPNGVVRAWMSSSSHKKSIMNERHEFMGVGGYVVGDGRFVWAQCFSL